MINSIKDRDPEEVKEECFLECLCRNAKLKANKKLTQTMSGALVAEKTGQ